MSRRRWSFSAFRHIVVFSGGGTSLVLCMFHPYPLYVRPALQKAPDALVQRRRYGFQPVCGQIVSRMLRKFKADEPAQHRFASTVVSSAMSSNVNPG